jgi:hypothetical protein
MVVRRLSNPRRRNHAGRGGKFFVLLGVVKIWTQ